MGLHTQKEVGGELRGETERQRQLVFQFVMVYCNDSVPQCKASAVQKFVRKRSASHYYYYITSNKDISQYFWNILQEKCPCRGANCKSFHFKQLKKNTRTIEKVCLSLLNSESIASPFIIFCYCCMHNAILAIYLKRSLLICYIAKEAKG